MKAQRIMTENEIGKIVVDTAITIHKALGSGVYEIVYLCEDYLIEVKHTAFLY